MLIPLISVAILSVSRRHAVNLTSSATASIAGSESFIPASDDGNWYESYLISLKKERLLRLASASHLHAPAHPDYAHTWAVGFACRYTGRTRIDSDGSRSFDWEGTQMWVVCEEMGS